MVKELTPEARKQLMADHWAHITSIQNQNARRKYPRIGEIKGLPPLHVMSFNEFKKSRGY